MNKKIIIQYVMIAVWREATNEIILNNKMHVGLVGPRIKKILLNRASIAMLLREYSLFL
jgi:hypothetical protein